METFEELIQSDTPLLVDFHAEWCGPCKAMAPVITEVAREVSGKARVIKIDIDKSPSTASRFQVQAVPTLALFRKGQVVWRHAGTIDKASLLQALRNHS